MAYPNPPYGYQQTHTGGEMDGKVSQYYAENEADVLESSLLNADVMRNSDPAQMGKASFVTSHGILSPIEPQGWAQYGSSASIDHAVGVAHTYHEAHHSMAQAPPHPMQHLGQLPQPQSWTYEQGSGDSTPTNRMDFDHAHATHPFGGPSYMHQRTDSARGSFSQPVRPATFHTPGEDYIPAPQGHSPHCHQDYLTMTAQETESRPHLKRLRGQSPPHLSVDYHRGDGIRKKNARIDIPHERSIQTIEQLLETVTDEGELKELKQQKRLLRNREAALASRQRKKKHTEELEHREKDASRNMDGLHAQIDELSAEIRNRECHYNILAQRFEESRRNVQTLEEEKRALIVEHGQETAQLRKRAQILAEQLEDMAPPMSTVPSSTGFADFTADMDDLNMGEFRWDSFEFGTELNTEPLDEINFDNASNHSTLPPSHPAKSEGSSVTVSAPPRAASVSSPDQHVTSSLLFFLLLCGAFVASRPASSHTTDLPHVPADVRAAAPKVLDNLLYEGQGQASLTNARTKHLEGTEPGPSRAPTTSTRPRSKLDRMHQHLTTPSRQQEIDTAFSLTNAEYASIANVDAFAHDDTLSIQQDETPSRSRRNLAETLASMQDDHGQSSKAEVYTRSLLLDQIPADVVKQFKELVRDHNEIEARQRQDNDETMTYKTET